MNYILPTTLLVLATARLVLAAALDIFRPFSVFCIVLQKQLIMRIQSNVVVAVMKHTE